MPHPLEASFNSAMMDLYYRARDEAHYNATRFLRMVGEQGGYQTALYLLHATSTSDGFAALWERGRLDLTVEALILQRRWDDLFTDADRAIARERLRSYGIQTG